MSARACSKACSGSTFNPRREFDLRVQQAADRSRRTSSGGSSRSASACWVRDRHSSGAEDLANARAAKSCRSDPRRGRNVLPAGSRGRCPGTAGGCQTTVAGSPRLHNVVANLHVGGQNLEETPGAPPQPVWRLRTSRSCANTTRLVLLQSMSCSTSWSRSHRATISVRHHRADGLSPTSKPRLA